MSKKIRESNVLSKMPDGVKKNLAAGEEIISFLKSFVVAERTNYIILTNNRLIYFDEKFLGRYVFKSLPFQKLLQIKAHKGAVVWGEVTFKMEDKSTYTVERVNRNDLSRFIEALEIAYNNIAVEPVAMKRQGDLLGITDWEFNKPEEVVFRQQSSNQQRSIDDPLAQLKLRFVKGEISEEEYKAKLRVLQE